MVEKIAATSIPDKSMATCPNSANPFILKTIGIRQTHTATQNFNIVIMLRGPGITAAMFDTDPILITTLHRDRLTHTDIAVIIVLFTAILAVAGQFGLRHLRMAG
jgi:hypothetical protein